MPVQTRNKAALAQRLDQQTYKGNIRQDPAHFVTCTVRDERKPYTITFDPAKVEQMREKYGDKLILPQKGKAF